MSNKTKNILILVGTRPNFIKVTQFKEVVKKHSQFNLKIVHTGQHYDTNMAEVFFDQFGLRPDYFLEVGKGTPSAQIAHIILGLEKLIENDYKADLLIVPGDVNSTLAGAITANKMGIKLAHLESGLRSFDRTMPEEINRILTDEVADYYFVTERSGEINLKQEKKSGEIVPVGNTMIDTLVAFETQIDQSIVLEKLNLKPSEFILMTIHRPRNVDSKEGLDKLLTLLKYLSVNYKIVFPIHPRTIAKLEQYGLKEELDSLANLVLTGPIGYFEFQKLVKTTKMVLTDSGGIQEETTFRQVPCLTLRPNTERPITSEIGTNTLVPFDVEVIKKSITQIELGEYKKGKIPEMWDGKATERIMDFLARSYD